MQSRVIFNGFHKINSIEYLPKLLYHQHSLSARKVFFFWHICVPASADLPSRPFTCESTISKALSLLVWWSPVASTSVHSPTLRTVRPWTISYYGMRFSLRSAKTNNCCFSKPSLDENLRASPFSCWMRATLQSQSFFILDVSKLYRIVPGCKVALQSHPWM